MVPLCIVFSAKSRMRWKERLFGRSLVRATEKKGRQSPPFFLGHNG